MSDDNELACSSCGLTMGQSRALEETVSNALARMVAVLTAEPVPKCRKSRILTLAVTDGEFSSLRSAKRTAIRRTASPITDRMFRERTYSHVVVTAHGDSERMTFAWPGVKRRETRRLAGTSVYVWEIVL